MSYVEPNEFVKTMVNAGESKLSMGARDVLLRAFMAGAILAIAVALAFTAVVETGYLIVGALIFPVGFCILNLLGFDLLTGVFALVPLALFDKRPGASFSGVLKNWGLVALGNLLGALFSATLIAISLTFAFSTEPTAVGRAFAVAAESRTLGFAEYGAAGWFTVFVKGILCNWLVSIGVVSAMISTTVGGKVIAMWMPIMMFFGLVFEHAVVNMYLFPLGMMMGASITVGDWLFWNEIPVILGNLVGGLLLTGSVLFITHLRPSSGCVAEQKTVERAAVEK